MAKYDSTDRAILARLQQDGRIANVDLAEAVALSPSACLRRVRALEQDGLIAGYRVELDRARLGLDLTVFVELRVDRHSRDNAKRIEAKLTAIPEIVACHVISGRADILVEAAVANLAAYEHLLIDQILTIPSIVDAHSTFAIRTIKTRGPLPLAQLP
ncbi:Lrp/AsnC family transcriptional regulator, leucine-responsive regulatory protein [Asanoa hainanensis]|uniref:Lrp/AsnC family transcriptional regulator, leucine-responsive regulatory protein n=1 Tax=Asanoa hainanensis TaxID=560556 RepID=A0A239KD59_9ACTN|nr:Lrp/AsnC family transcriptional regulator [Asanoa hainanensis]SNT15920.1 Lrp/AsnC family transcriptional regulator, leucine-responsive regulatory protein [Asanoa hainanensis]